MPDSRLKEKQRKSTKLFEACDRCGKAKPEAWGTTITRWVFQLQTCDCKTQVPADSQAIASLIPATPECTKQPGGNESQGEQFEETTVDLGDCYEILETIGQGGMGTVYRVKDKTLQKEFAVKVLRDDFATDPSAIKRFEQEADAASSLTHPNMLATYGRGSTTSGAHYIVMDLLEGESLSQLLKREAKLEASRVIGISTQICDALAHAHMKGLIHRDLKPSNVMLTNNGQGPDTVKVLDFGIAKLMPTSNRETQNLTETGDLFGSPAYMSPEQCLGFSVDARSDIYSLGCMMYEMLSGQPPFGGKNPIQTVVKHLNEEPPPLQKLLPTGRTNAKLQSVIMRCLEKDAGQRYQSMDQLKVDLQLVAGGKLPKQPKKVVHKPIPLAFPALLTLIVLGLVWAGAQMTSIIGLGFETLPPLVSKTLTVSFFSIVALCAVTWVTSIGQLSWNQFKKLRGRSPAPHERWKVGMLVAFFTGLLPVTALVLLAALSSTLSSLFQHNPISQLSNEDVFPAILAANVSFVVASAASLAWILTRSAAALGFSLATQKRVSIVLITFLTGLFIFDRPLVAWIPFASSFGYVKPSLDLALWINPDFPEAIYKKAQMKPENQKLDAIKDYSKVISLHPNKSLEKSARRNRAELYEFTGDFDKAIDDIGIAIQLDETDPDYSTDHINRARCYTKAKQYEKALADYDYVINHFVLSADNYYQRGKTYEQLGNEEQALSDYAEAIARDPRDLHYYNARATLYETLGQRDKALADYKRMHDCVVEGGFEQGDAETYRSEARAERALGHLEEAEKLSAKASKIQKDTVNASPRVRHY